MFNSKSYSTQDTPSVHHKKSQSIRNFVLDRPAALNALNLEMIYNITPQLQAWQEADLCKVIVLSSAPGSRAFCAGGDVKQIVIDAKESLAGVRKGALFFEQEYKLNHLIATTKKPFVSILDGVTMGGGVGLSVHGHFRIVTENTLIAMPETSIGLFPDVGGSFFLPRMDGELGTFLGLTGHRLKGEEVYISGFGTHFVPSSRIPALMERLAELETDELDVVNAAIDEFSGELTTEQFKNWSLGGKVGDLIDRCFKHYTIEEIISSLEAETQNSDEELAAFATKQLKVLKAASPTSLKVTLAQLRRGARMHIADCFKMEYRLAQQFLVSPDFLEGVTAKLINKTAAAWNPSFDQLSSISEKEIDEKFFGERDTPDLELYNRLSYYDYPHRTLSGLPTDRDVFRVVNGEGRRGARTAKPNTKLEVMEWIKQNWGRYDAGVVGEIYIPTMNTLDGGRGKGKVGLLEKVQAILDRHAKETKSGIEWH
ncbi:hypothetical protein HDV06_005789 [Boothiomyces sp. JEL0866]|nr:hypothetical protein HDV06_005789 [Boothiomyces sp. JEL0866]